MASSEVKTRFLDAEAHGSSGGMSATLTSQERQELQTKKENKACLQAYTYARKFIDFKMPQNEVLDLVRSYATIMPKSAILYVYNYSIDPCEKHTNKRFMIINKSTQGYDVEYNSIEAHFYIAEYPNIDSVMKEVSTLGDVKVIRVDDVSARSESLFYNEKPTDGVEILPLPSAGPGTMIIRSRTSPDIVLSKIPINENKQFHGVEERFFFSTNGQPLAFRHWLNGRQVTHEEYAKAMKPIIAAASGLLPDLSGIIGLF